MFQKIKLFTAALVLTTVLFSCGKDDNPDNNIVTYKTTLSGANEVPSNTSTATGNATLTYNKSTKAFSIVTNFQGLTPTMGHIHKAVKDFNGPVLFPFSDVGISPIKFDGVLTDAQFLALDKDSMYVNLHTATNPGGELRGQLIRQ